jgi:hypothetical protein
MAYGEFISRVQNSTKMKVCSGYLLDRVMRNYSSERARHSNEIHDGGIAAEPCLSGGSDSAMYPVDFALTSLNMAVSSPPSERVDCLFTIGTILDRVEVSDEIDSKVIDSPQRITVDSSVRMIDNLLKSWQVPNEVRVIEIEGDDIPLKKYREKEAQEMVSEY